MGRVGEFLKKDIGGKKPGSKGLPRKVKGAVIILWVLGVLWLLAGLSLFGLALERWGDEDAGLLLMMGPVVFLLGALAIFAAVKLRRGSPVGRIIGFCLVPFTLPGLPVLILGAVLVVQLVSKEVSDYIRACQHGGGEEDEESAPPLQLED